MPKSDSGLGKLKLIKGSNNVDDVLKGTDEHELVRGFSGDTKPADIAKAKPPYLEGDRR